MLFSKNILKLSAILIALLLSGVSYAEGNSFIDSVSTDFATGTRTEKLTLGVQSNWNKRWLDTGESHLSGYWDFNVSEWHENRYRNVVGATRQLYDIGVDPVFRFEKNDLKGIYYELGIGFHRLSQFYNNDGYRLSTLFEFGDHIGIGYIFDNHWEVALKIEHFSNGGYSEPNSGVNFADVKLAYHF